MDAMTYKVPLVNMGILDARFQKLAKQAQKLGLIAPTYEILGRIPAQTDEWGRIIVPAKNEIRVTGEFPKLPGYIFVGTVEHTPAGNILRSAPGQNISEQYRTVDFTCDHCQTIRRRKDTFVVRSEERNADLRVGRACLKDFLGGKSPQDVAWFYTFLKEMDECQSEFDSYPSVKGFDPVDYLSNVAAMVRHSGFYLSKSKCTEPHQTPTSNQAFSNMILARSNDRKEREKAIPVTQDDLTFAEELLAWAKDLEPKTSYDHNLKLVSQKELLASRDLGLIASLVPAYKYAMGEIEKKAQKEKAFNALPPSAHLGEVGKRQEWKLVLKKTLKFDGDFGPCYYYLFQDESGNDLVWKTGTEMDWKEGEVQLVKATVKRHGDYKGRPQTELSRLVRVENSCTNLTI